MILPRRSIFALRRSPCTVSREVIVDKLFVSAPTVIFILFVYLSKIAYAHYNNCNFCPLIDLIITDNIYQQNYELTQINNLEFSDIYLFNPSDSFINKFRAKYGAKTIKALQGTTLLELKTTTP